MGSQKNKAFYRVEKSTLFLRVYEIFSMDIDKRTNSESIIVANFQSFENNKFVILKKHNTSY